MFEVAAGKWPHVNVLGGGGGGEIKKVLKVDAMAKKNMSYKSNVPSRKLISLQQNGEKKIQYKNH